MKVPLMTRLAKTGLKLNIQINNLQPSNAESPHPATAEVRNSCSRQTEKSFIMNKLEDTRQKQCDLKDEDSDLKQIQSTQLYNQPSEDFNLVLNHTKYQIIKEYFFNLSPAFEGENECICQERARMEMDILRFKMERDERCKTN